MKEKLNAFFGKDTEFEGKLSFSGAVRIDGYFKGEVSTEGTLLIGSTAIVEADINADKIIISGQAKGTLIAKSRIEICSPGKVSGNIQAPVVTMEEGVIFEGHCSMRGKKGDIDKKIALLNK